MNDYVFYIINQTEKENVVSIRTHTLHKAIKLCEEEYPDCKIIDIQVYPIN